MRLKFPSKAIADYDRRESKLVPKLSRCDCSVSDLTTSLRLDLYQTPKTTMLAVTILFASISCYIIYLVFVRHLFSTFHDLPRAQQQNLFLRLFHEPNTFELQRWIKETPNDGLLRYFGFMNQERLLMTKPKTLNEVLQREAHKFVKLPWLAAVQNPAGVSGLVTSKGNLHRVR